MANDAKASGWMNDLARVEVGQLKRSRSKNETYWALMAPETSTTPTMRTWASVPGAKRHRVPAAGPTRQLEVIRSLLRHSLPLEARYAAHLTAPE